MMNIQFELEGEAGRRTAYRERVRGLMAQLDDGGETFVVHDVSATGIALVDPDGKLATGRTCHLSLCIGPKSLVADLPATVVRKADQGLVGLAFGQLSLRQEGWLDKLVLEIQKRRIDLRKAQADVSGNPEDKKIDRVDDKT